MPTLSVERRDAVAVVTLNRPDVRNTISLEMVAELIGAFDELEGAREVGAVVVTGAGRAFCAGADMQRLELGDKAEFRRIYEAFLRVARCTLPTVAAVNGPAVGAGFNLALACDLRLASPTARFAARFPQIGLHPGGGHIWMLQRAVGPQTASAMLHFGVELDGEEAARLGLVWRCVDGDALLEAAVALAQNAARIPRALNERIKQSRRLVTALADHDAAVELELEAQAWSASQPFYRESLAAFVEQLASHRRET